MYFIDYILSSPTAAQETLIAVFEILDKEFWMAERKIYHRLPTYFYMDCDLINIGAHKNHITLYVGYDLVNYFKEKYTEHKYTKAAISIPYNIPFPFEFLKEICKEIRKLRLS